MAFKRNDEGAHGGIKPAEPADTGGWREVGLVIRAKRVAPSVLSVWEDDESGAARDSFLYSHPKAEWMDDELLASYAHDMGDDGMAVMLMQ